MAEAQQSETNIAQFQEWLDHVHAQIISRIENDLTSDDLPDDVQVYILNFFKYFFPTFTIITIFLFNRGYWMSLTNKLILSRKWKLKFGGTSQRGNLKQLLG